MHGVALLLFTVVVLTAPLVSGVHAQEPEKSTLEKNREEILGRIETLERGLKVTRGCVDAAETAEEMERCYELTKVRKFEAVQDMLFEIGTGWEERRYKRMLQEKGVP
jgi:hypothetical protein